MTVQHLEADVRLALIFGTGVDELAPSDAPLDLLLVSPDLKRKEAASVLAQAGRRIGREIRLSLLSPDRFQGLWAARDNRLMAVLAQPRILLQGELPPP